MAKRHRSRALSRRACLLLGLAALAITAALSLLIGSNPIPFLDVLAALTNNADDHTAYVVLGLRVPRTSAGIVVGAALGCSGALVQSLTRNPLAEPGILGVSSGAAFCVTIAVAVLGLKTPEKYMWFALVGALLATVMVMLVGSRKGGRPDPVRLILAGIAFSAFLNGIVGILRLANPRTFNEVLVWSAGTLESRTFEAIVPVLPLIAIGLLIALMISQSLNAIELGDDAALALGAHVTATRILCVLSVTLLAGGSVAIAGPISFIGLMAPHAIRPFSGPDQRWVIGLSTLWAPVLVLASDVVGRVILSSGEMPVSVVSAFIGAPVLINLVRRRRAFSL